MGGGSGSALAPAGFGNLRRERRRGGPRRRGPNRWCAGMRWPIVAIVVVAMAGASPSVSPENVKHAAMFGLSAAAMKSKLFADQEEREVQRPAATVINHQLKRLELKLKQFAEVETLLLKECEQVERVRQRISAERVRTRQA
ncbi:unnamed protein product [Miscanthus lutarioriparius]|uniref:SMARCC C-terminal domain-containing protein n=1 Tax=Miscanthus lutarioriparius TaxID=422564 RepID=A0A811SLV4_9POAL|nr:unnamed protein product [Miscanthus lutarioriparius]